MIGPKSCLWMGLLFLFLAPAACGGRNAPAQQMAAESEVGSGLASLASPTTRSPALSSGTPLRVYSDESSPTAEAQGVAARLWPNGQVSAAPSPAESDLDLGAEQGTSLIYERILVPVDRFSTMLNGTTMDELKGVWRGDNVSPSYATIYPSQDIMPDLVLLLGPAGPAVKPREPGAVAGAIWEDPTSIGIVPFEALNVRLRALPIDGLSVVDNRLDQAQWSLATRVWATPKSEQGTQALEAVAKALPDTNRDPRKLTVLVMTGVTAMARGTAAAIEEAGDYAFPARIVGPELAAADITIVSNEIPFITDCVPDNTLNNLILCSKPEYFSALQVSGVDAVGLTGNHLNDFGYENDLASLKLYEGMGIPTYGGGKDDNAARQPYIVEHNGNRLAFLGANQYGPEEYTCGTGEAVSAWAGAENPGSARFDRAQMSLDIQSVKPNVDLVLAELQHTEFNDAGDYQTEPIAAQVVDSEALVDAGADIVTGVQAHAPQGVELRGNGIILYGLGNLYFDQTWSWPTRTGLVVRHAIYDGRLINTELLVTVNEMNMQLRWATPEERIEVLKSVYAASRW